MTRRREQKWHDKEFCRANLGSEWKKPFAGCSHSKGIVLEKMCVAAPRRSRRALEPPTTAAVRSRRSVFREPRLWQRAAGLRTPLLGAQRRAGATHRP